jgi:hypothetical protein
VTLHPIDQIPLWAVFLFLTVLLFATAELGYRLGRWRTRRPNEEERGQAGTIMGVALGMLAFLMAFSFGTAASIHQNRKALVLDEANAIGTAYLRAQILPEPAGPELRQLLRRYVNLQVKGGESVVLSEVKQATAGSEALQDAMWERTARLAKEHPESIIAGLFVESLNEVFDLHSKRVAAARNRIPRSLGLTLLFVSVMGMTMMGYYAGLTGVRALISRLSLILAFVSVLVLIVGLDRPRQILVRVSQQAMVDLQTGMNKTRE